MFQFSIYARVIAFAAIAVFAGTPDRAQAQQPGQKTFASSAEACAALVKAVEQEGNSSLVEILGPTAKQIISAGDEVEDRNSQRQFVEKYREMHRLVREPDGTITIYVGADNWPMPIILRRKATRWYFDPVASKAEILFRRIGRNELRTIDICRELVNAQNEQRDGEVQPYVSRLINDTTRPFHGYYYRILKRQGKHAPGGAKDYTVDGRMSGGFAFVAYPAEYRSSGVMTFIVNKDGTVYQKDLGQRTAVRAGAMIQYDPDATWKRVE